MKRKKKKTISLKPQKKVAKALKTKHFLRSKDKLVPQRLSTDGNNVFS